MEREEILERLKQTWKEEFATHPKIWKELDVTAQLNEFKAHPFYQETVNAGIKDLDLAEIMQQSFISAKENSGETGIKIIPFKISAKAPVVNNTVKTQSAKRVVKVVQPVKSIKTQSLPKENKISEIMETNQPKKLNGGNGPLSGFYNPQTAPDFDVSGENPEGIEQPEMVRNEGGNETPNQQNNVPSSRKPNMWNTLLMLVGAVVISVVIGMFMFVKGGVYTGDLTALQRQIVDNKGLLDTSVLATGTKISDVQVTINKSISDINSKLANQNYASKTDLATYATKGDLTSAQTTMQKSVDTAISSIQSTGTNTPTKADLQNAKDGMSAVVNAAAQAQQKQINDAISGFQTKLDTANNTIATLTTQVTGLQKTVELLGTGTGSGAGTGTGTGTITATIANNPFTGSSSINFTDIAAGSSTSQTLTVQLNNTFTKQLQSVQLALGLQLVTPTGTVLTNGLPTGSAVTVSGLPLIWTAQSTGVPYILGYTNTSSSSFLGTLGALNINAGTNMNISITVTVGNTGTNPIPAFMVIPVAKVLTYQ